MSSTTWTRSAVASEAVAWQASAWRMVEAQHIASTMKLVDSREEQDVLEALIEGNKPALPPVPKGLHYLLATPFRYPPLHGGSRFRDITDPGVFYGAETLRTAAAELAYWRWRFLKDAVDLERLGPVAHTAFQSSIATRLVELRKPPFDRNRKRWEHPSDYQPTQALARIVREAGLGGIVYRSVRDAEPAWCLALLEPSGFAKLKPDPKMQTWFLAVSQEGATWRREQEAMGFAASGWVS